MVTKKELKKIEKIEKRTTKEDLAIFNRIHRLLRQVYRLEAGKKLESYGKVKSKERDVLKLLNKLKQDTVKELRFAQILRPTNRTQRAIVAIFGPFLSPSPTRVVQTEDYLNSRGVELGTNGGPHAAYKGGTIALSGYETGNPVQDLADGMAKTEGMLPKTPEFRARTLELSNELTSALGHNVTQTTGQIPEYASTTKHVPSQGPATM